MKHTLLRKPAVPYAVDAATVTAKAFLSTKAPRLQLFENCLPLFGNGCRLVW
jgi:hypothetical protein